MKTLWLVRHAKSSWGDSTLPDRERPLEARGERDLAKMCKRWSHRHSKPDLILSSPARRTLATAAAFAESLGYPPDRIVVDDRLYAASAEALIAVIEALDDKLERVMLVGHNPGLSDLARHFSDEIMGMPTCAIAEFTFEGKRWSGVGRAKPARSTFESPKQVQG